MVMLVYYIISGVEIISTEIENPFAGDPNDLPISKLFANIWQKHQFITIKVINPAALFLKEIDIDSPIDVEAKTEPSFST